MKVFFSLTENTEKLFFRSAQEIVCARHSPSKLDSALAYSNFPTDSTDFSDIFFFYYSIFIKILFTLGITQINLTFALAYNKIRSFAMQKSLYG